MAVTPTHLAEQAAIDLGAGVQALQALQMPAVLVAAQPPSATGRARTEPVLPGPMTLGWQPMLADGLNRWAQAALQGQRSGQDGQLLVLDTGTKQTRRSLHFSQALVTTVRLGALDAAAKTPFLLSLDALPDALQAGPAGAKVVLPPVGKRKPLLSGNFRVAGLPGDVTMVRRVRFDDIVLPPPARAGEGREPLLLPSPPVTLQVEVAGRDADTVLAWAAKLLADGVLGPDAGLALTIELLDSTLSKPLAAIKLTDCRLRRCDEPAIGGGSAADAVHSATLTLVAAQLGFTLLG